MVINNNRQHSYFTTLFIVYILFFICFINNNVVDARISSRSSSSSSDSSSSSSLLNSLERTDSSSSSSFESQDDMCRFKDTRTGKLFDLTVPGKETYSRHVIEDSYWKYMYHFSVCGLVDRHCPVDQIPSQSQSCQVFDDVHSYTPQPTGLLSTRLAKVINDKTIQFQYNVEGDKGCPKGRTSTYTLECDETKDTPQFEDIQCSAQTCHYQCYIRSSYACPIKPSTNVLKKKKELVYSQLEPWAAGSKTIELVGEFSEMDDTEISVAGMVCHITEFTKTRIYCTIPSYPNIDSGRYYDLEFHNGQYSSIVEVYFPAYDTPKQNRLLCEKDITLCSVPTILKSSISIVPSQVISLYGNFGTQNEISLDNIEIALSNEDHYFGCRITSFSQHEIKCRIKTSDYPYSGGNFDLSLGYGSPDHNGAGTTSQIYLEPFQLLANR
ncbi:hypothetical protein DFA_02343 [Cavenderia fasciculata]|uniref:MRH domain-containing protein n=1 Tax=Cavenderia fasciculata TaxID=261658 RepID=F4PZ68_CACFS|nr:uncharacterized protein DFA_02343 [Cavenderia fasciculata]EGG19097.1 hypothetical protein DFA_02343 [Cavenderia fasciculata]|eukprot:XP_004366730.1 hypothetical protein DFA_02343 [Cavenderia fasciculata]